MLSRTVPNIGSSSVLSEPERSPHQLVASRALGVQHHDLQHHS